MQYAELGKGELGADRQVGTVLTDSSLADNDTAQELVQSGAVKGQVAKLITPRCNALFVITDGKLQVTRHDTNFLVVARCISCKLEDFCSEVLQDSCQVDWGIIPASQARGEVSQ